MAKKKHLFSWQKWFNNEVTATVEQASKDTILLECSSIKPLLRAVAGEFTTTGTVRTCGQIQLYTTQNDLPCQRAFLTMSGAYAKSNPITLVFNPTGKGKTVTKTVTNNITS